MLAPPLLQRYLSAICVRETTQRVRKSHGLRKDRRVPAKVGRYVPFSAAPPTPADTLRQPFMSISTNQFKNGAHIEVDGQIYRIMDFQHVKPGKGGAFVRTKLRRASDGGVVDKTFRAGEKFRPVRTETQRMQYLYDSGEMAVFMNTESYEQTEISSDTAGDDMKWVRPNDTVEVLYVDEKPTGVQVPSAVDLTVARTDPGLKGDTASGGGSKPATLETGVEIQVPLFIEEGEVVRVDTRSGEYVSRA